jgi:hypothetical protein
MVRTKDGLWMDGIYWGYTKSEARRSRKMAERATRKAERQMRKDAKIFVARNETALHNLCAGR